MASSIHKLINNINTIIGKVISPVIVLMTCLVVVDVFLRYIFDRPIVWSWDVNIQLFGMFSMMGAGFTLLHKGHVGVDVLMTNLSEKRQAILRVITFPIFILGTSVLLLGAIEGAWDSVLEKESYSSYVGLPIYPLKVLFVVAIILFVLQGIANLIGDIDCIRERN